MDATGQDADLQADEYTSRPTVPVTRTRQRASVLRRSFPVFPGQSHHSRNMFRMPV